MKASFSEYLSAREDWVQDILGYYSYTKSLLDDDDNDSGNVIMMMMNMTTMMMGDKLVEQSPLGTQHLMLLSYVHTVAQTVNSQHKQPNISDMKLRTGTNSTVLPRNPKLTRKPHRTQRNSRRRVSNVLVNNLTYIF